MQEKTLKEKVFEVVNKIPFGKVAYYGQIAIVVGTDPRTVGWILSGMPQSEYVLIPWHRVVGKTGYIAALKLGPKGLLQKEILLQEGVEIIEDFVDMKKYCIESF